MFEEYLTDFANAFQSLVGSVETQKVVSVRGLRKRFQSLVGSVETGVATFAWALKGMFQSLVGSVETLPYGIFARIIQIVSISGR